MRERVKLPPSKEVIEYLIRPRLESVSLASFETMMDLNRAHVAMLATKGIMTQADASKLMRVLQTVLSEGPNSIAWNPELEEAYYNIEAHIISKAGATVGGQMHTGRSRNDLGAALSRISTRTQVAALAVNLHALREVLLTLAEEHSDTIVTGYTHMQPAQPTTLGHYFHAVAQALLRDEVRLQQAYETVNKCPLGACAFNATGFDIDRHMLADLTGFSDLAENSIDALASRDYASQVLSTLAILSVTLSRLAQDLYTWGTDEFGWLELGDDVATTSSIMPQKKNPITLEHIRAKSAHLIGAVVATLTAQKGTAFGHMRDISLESTVPLKDGFREAEAIVNLTTATLRSVRVKEGVAEARAGINFSTVTELADVMVREVGLSFREAHIVVGVAVGELTERGAGPDELDLELLNRVAQEQLGRRLGLSKESVRRALSPRENVMIRAVTGGPAPKEVLRSILVSREQLATQEAWWREQALHLESARHRLNAESDRHAAT